MKTIIFLIALLIGLSWVHAQGQSDHIATLRLSPLEVEPDPPRIANVLDTDIRRGRIHPMQPPTIPHKIDNYQVDLKANRCMSCHSRTRIEETQAPMVSVTHYTSRDGEVLAEISPRRYFCTQCHVPQTDARPLVDNTFEDVAEILAGQQQAGQ